MTHVIRCDQCGQDCGPLRIRVQAVDSERLYEPEQRATLDLCGDECAKTFWANNFLWLGSIA